jgi:hypothetical protein
LWVVESKQVKQVMAEGVLVGLVMVLVGAAGVQVQQIMIKETSKPTMEVVGQAVIS